MSAKFAKVALIDSGKRVMIHGVTRSSHGIPPCITQEALTKKEDLLRAQGTLKAALLIGDSACPGLVTASLMIPSQSISCEIHAQVLVGRRKNARFFTKKWVSVFRFLFTG